jgi:hypothetical protein
MVIARVSLSNSAVENTELSYIPLHFQGGVDAIKQCREATVIRSGRGMSGANASAIARSNQQSLSTNREAHLILLRLLTI